MSHLRIRTSQLALVALMLSPTFIAAKCSGPVSLGGDTTSNDKPASDGTTDGTTKPDGMTPDGSKPDGSKPGGSVLPGNGTTTDPNACDPSECKDLPAPPATATNKCSDGSTTGPVCTRIDKGSCEWAVPACPSDMDPCIADKTCAPATTSQFQCSKDSMVVIDAKQVCDGNKDCPDGSDELQCTPSMSPFACDDMKKTVIDAKQVCDGNKDCPNGLDEASCPGPMSFLCSDQKTPIDPKQVCDGQKDCPDGSDELKCDPGTTEPICANGDDIASQYSPAKECVLAKVNLGCAQDYEPKPTVPAKYPDVLCARRISDKALFLVGQPELSGAWVECTPEEAMLVAGAKPCF